MTQAHSHAPDLTKKNLETGDIALVLISHDLGLVRHMADWVAVMYLGRIVETARAEALFAEPRHPYTQALLSAIPVPSPVARRDRRLLPGDPPSPIDPPSGCHLHTRCPHAIARCKTEVPALVEAATASAMPPPPPSWGRAGEGGMARSVDGAPGVPAAVGFPPPLTPPHEGEGNRTTNSESAAPAAASHATACHLWCDIAKSPHLLPSGEAPSPRLASLIRAFENEGAG